jgi:hypothetical protein
MAFTPGNPSNSVNALEVVLSNFEYLQAGAEEVLLPEIKWTEVIPRESIDTSVNPGARSASYLVRDRRGRGEFRGRAGKNIPTVGVTVDKVQVPIESAGVSANFDRADARAVQMGHEMNLLTELGQVMREASERHIEGTFFYGFDEIKYRGFLDYPGVPFADVALNAGATSTLWVNKTNDEIIRDVQGIQADVFVLTKGVHIVTDIYLPPAQFIALTIRKVGTTGDKSIMAWLEENSLAVRKGLKLTFHDLRYLEGAGVDDTDRMVAMEKKGRNFWLPMSLPFDMLEPEKRGFGVDLLAEYVFGSFHIKYPLSMAYRDGI